MPIKLRIKTKDKVVVITGRDKGKTGEVIEVLPKERRVKVRGVNLVTKHVRPSQTSQGGITQIEAFIDVSNVAHLDPKTNQPTRVGYKILPDGRKVRFAKRSGEAIDL
ncbi:MAG: 50S ribosomal protein L24 [Azospirillaceae bacterium]|nr:50S ribosomal protein L24 [Azospirillaceae bacterium]